MIVFKKIFFFIFLIINNCFLYAQTADEIISKHVELIGGENWKKTKSIVTLGTYNYGGMVFSFTSFAKAPDLYKYVVSLNGKNYTQSYDGKNGWKLDGFNNDSIPTFLAGKAARAMANENDVELESPLINYKKKGHHAFSEGLDTVENSACFKIKFISKDGDTAIYFFNNQNYELLMKSAVSKNAEMKNAMLDTYYSDYRAVSGIKIPFKSISKVNEQTILTVTIDKVELNAPVKEDIFDP